MNERIIMLLDGQGFMDAPEHVAAGSMISMDVNLFDITPRNFIYPSLAPRYL